MMMPIDLTAQFAPILEGMVLLLVVAGAGIVFEALRGTVSHRPKAATRPNSWGAAPKPLRA